MCEMLSGEHRQNRENAPPKPKNSIVVHGAHHEYGHVSIKTSAAEGCALVPAQLHSQLPPGAKERFISETQHRFPDLFGLCQVC